MAVPELWLIAGPNGAGKTTVVRRIPLQNVIARLEILNPDARTLQRLRARGFAGFAEAPADTLQREFIAAAGEVEDELWRRLKAGATVAAETVLSTPKYRAHVDWVKRSGGLFNLIFITLASPEISSRRIAQRVREQGHDVPADRLAGRWRRAHEQLGWFAAQADCFWVFDNSDERPEAAPVLRAWGGGGGVSLAAGAPGYLQEALARLTPSD
jgi:predicted ABC-type ATPase